MTYPEKILNFINGEVTGGSNTGGIPKYNPHDASLLGEIYNSNENDVSRAMTVAQDAFLSWSQLTPVKRGQHLADVVTMIKNRRQELEEIVALETGKPIQDATGEVGAAILQGEFFAGEGMRLYARSLTSGMPGKQSHTVRQPLGVAVLIVPANTPIANIAWKVFPALICGNSVVLKASEDAPYTALYFALLCKEAGIPNGVVNVIQGSGESAGMPLVIHNKTAVISFTGSTAVGKWIGEQAGKRLTKVSLELGGKNPFIVCDDADLDNAVKWASLSAFSNAGQRCASGSRIIVHERIYDAFLSAFVNKANSLTLGVSKGSDLGPVINERAFQTILGAIERCRAEGAKIECGGERGTAPETAKGYYVRPTIISGVDPKSEVSRKELFGPVACIYKVDSLDTAIAIANDSEYGLTSAIHTKDVNKALRFARSIRAGVANINFGTFGSEPHMPFGGFGWSGNGTREPGTEALDVYSELKNISFLEI